RGIPCARRHGEGERRAPRRGAVRYAARADRIPGTAGHPGGRYPTKPAGGGGDERRGRRSPPDRTVGPRFHLEPGREGGPRPRERGSVLRRLGPPRVGARRTRDDAGRRGGRWAAAGQTLQTGDGESW